VIDCSKGVEGAGEGVGGDCWGHDCRVYDNVNRKAMNLICMK
jgi:hypothetical protein